MNKTFYVHDEKPLLLKFDRDANITIIIDTTEANIEYVLDGGNYNIMVYHRSNDLSLNESGYINAQANINYIDLESSKLIQNTDIKVGRHGLLNVHSTYLASNDKMINFNFTNAEADSEINLDNSVVALKDVELLMNVVGNIVKGAKRSIHHQKNRCLTIDSLKKATIRPVLNIDENDVAASHSLSSGTINEDVLFYMNARGLNRATALLLMIESYLTLDKEVFELFENGLIIEEECKKKVNDLCLM